MKAVTSMRGPRDGDAHETDGVRFGAAPLQRRLKVIQMLEGSRCHVRSSSADSVPQKSPIILYMELELDKTFSI